MITLQETCLTPNRVPVVYKRIPLMPMRWKRAKRLVRSGYAKLARNKLGIIYLKLLYQPSGYKTKEHFVGIDPGSSFDGFSVVSSDKEHLMNIEVIHTKDIKKRMTQRRENRRCRRSRLWHRSARFDNRTSKKLTPTIRSKIDFRKQILLTLFSLFPQIDTVVIEDVRFNHYKNRNGTAFSLAEQGKSEFVRYIKDYLGIPVALKHGYTTKMARTYLFCGVDLKTKAKDSESFNAHCIDSFTLACLADDNLENVRGCQRQTIFIKKNYLCRRQLTKFKKRVKDSKDYFKYTKGGNKIILTHLSRLKKLRIKINDSKSNHGPWDYIYTKPSQTYKCFTSKYGGTVSHGNSRSSVKQGQSKRLTLPGGQYQNTVSKIVYK